MSAVDAAAKRPPTAIAGFPAQSWAFAIRIWIASVVSLLISFWLQLDAPSAAMLTVMILAEPTRGQALEKAGYRLVATIIGIIVSIAIVGSLSQSRDLLLVAFAVWIGLCIYACGLLDGYRAYAAVLAGYTVAFIAIQQIDNPLHVFQAAMERGAAIAVGVLSITLVNDLLSAPDRHPRLAIQLADFHRRVRNHARSIIRGEPVDAMKDAALIRDIVGLRSDISSLAAESSSGPVRSAAARSAMVALVAEVYAMRALGASPALPDANSRERLASLLDPSAAVSSSDGDEIDLPSTTPLPLARTLRELLRRDAEVQDHLFALKSVVRPSTSWRAPLYRSQRIAIENGVRAAGCVAVTAAALALAGWPNASVALSLVAVTLGLGATTPAPRAFTTLGLIGAPIAIALTGILEFYVLNGVSDFPLLAIGLAPFLIGAALLASLPVPILAGLGKINLIFISAIFAASNPQSYNPQSFLFTSLFICIATGLLLAAQYLIPPVSDAQRRRWLLASARQELETIPARRDRRYAPEEATFRDAARIGQIVAAGPILAHDRICIEQALAYFDQAAATRFDADRLTSLPYGGVAGLVTPGRATLSAPAQPAFKESGS